MVATRIEGREKRDRGENEEIKGKMTIGHEIQRQKRAFEIGTKEKGERR